MDEKLWKIMDSKIDEVIHHSDEILAITTSLGSLIESREDEEANTFGIALGRVYNAFHYQTRRILKRDATAEEFQEFVVMLSKRAGEIKKALQAARQAVHA
ncbi:MAG: hypothetical protein ACE5JV_03610 [Nitrososphaerales archaeon]